MTFLWSSRNLETLVERFPQYSWKWGRLLTIALSIQVNDGLVFAADSATTFSGPNNQVLNVYNNANKVFQLHKELPLGMITWGLGSLSQSSMATLAKDFRALITSDPQHKINPQQYTVKDVADKFFDFIYTQRYVPEMASWQDKPALGFTIGGFSSGASHAEQWSIHIEQGSGNCPGPVSLATPGQMMVEWHGMPEALDRLVKGYSGLLPSVLQFAGLTQPQIDLIKNLADQYMMAPIIMQGMPLKDVIDIARFLVDVAAKYTLYTPGSNGVGGPVEIAAITKHEDFKWIERKLYFAKELN